MSEKLKISRPEIKGSRQTHISGTVFTCPTCSRETFIEYNFCPNCGQEFEYSQAVLTLQMKGHKDGKKR